MAARWFWRPHSFAHYTLRQELLALAISFGLLASASWLTVEALTRRSVDLHRAEADRAGLQLQEHVAEAEATLVTFANLTSGERRWLAGRLFERFSDLYLLDGQQRVVQIYKQQQNSAVFPGFSFAGGRLGEHLRHNLAAEPKAGTITSPILWGREDGVASLYLARQEADGSTLLGRVDLSYIQTFLERFAAIIDAPLLLVSHEGLVMLTSDRTLPLAAIDLARAGRRPSPEPIATGDQRWLPLLGQNNPSGGQFVTLLSTRPLERNRQILGTATLAVASLLTALVLLKTLGLQRNLFLPFQVFASQLRRVEMGGGTSSRASAPVQFPSRFREVQQIQERFEAMVTAIEQREQDLRTALNISLTAAAVGHEIKQPLSSIRLLCQQALQTGSDPALRPLLSQLDRESSRVATTVERMAMLLRNVQSEHHPLNLATVALSAITFTRRQLQVQGAQLQVEGLEGAPLQSAELRVRGDQVQLQVAVANLLRNAGEALADRPPGQRQVRLRLLRRPTSPEHPQGLAGLEVADSGPGLGPLAQQLGLEGVPGADLSAELGRRPLRSQKASGSGLGLFVVRTALSHHGGWLEASRSQELGGAAFSLWLPLDASGGP